MHAFPGRQTRRGIARGYHAAGYDVELLLGQLVFRRACTGVELIVVGHGGILGVDEEILAG